MMATSFPHHHRKYYTGADSDSTLLWPYRTTPLVLPGAKVKKDAAPTESYLRHHPNPAMRAPPPNTLYPHDVVMKQKVADSVISRIVGEDPSGKQVVHKQFNTPIGLYSDQNIKDTIQSQTGIAPIFIDLSFLKNKTTSSNAFPQK